ncbi:hypothetical protein TcCL_NonESM00326, partial [Trypanosoma cruzi]
PTTALLSLDSFFILSWELGVLLLLKQLSKFGLEVLRVLVHLFVEFVGVLLNHFFKLFIVLLHFRGERALVGFVREELLVLFLHLLRELGVQAVKLGGEFLKSGGHFSLRYVAWAC